MNKRFSPLAALLLVTALSGCSGMSGSQDFNSSNGGGAGDGTTTDNDGTSTESVEPVDNRDPVLAAVEDTIRANCSNLPSDATVEGPTTFQEFLDPPRANIFYIASADNSDLYYWAYSLNGSSSSLTTAYAGQEELAAQFGCPTDINPR